MSRMSLAGAAVRRIAKSREGYRYMAGWREDEQMRSFVGARMVEAKCPICTATFISQDEAVSNRERDRHVSETHHWTPPVKMDWTIEDREFLSGCRIAVD